MKQCVCDNGWTGHDCTSELPCPMGPITASDIGSSAPVLAKCSGNGVCLATGVCECAAGWSGDGCALRKTPVKREDPPRRARRSQPVSSLLLQQVHGKPVGAFKDCPRNCCNNGRCQRDVCVCSVGWYGPSCAMNSTTWENFQRGVVPDAEQGELHPWLLSFGRIFRFALRHDTAHKASLDTCPGDTQVTSFGNGLAGAVGFNAQMSSGQSKGNPFQSVNNNDFSVTPPKNEDFGIQATNTNGHTGNIEGDARKIATSVVFVTGASVIARWGTTGRLAARSPLEAGKRSASSGRW